MLSWGARGLANKEIAFKLGIGLNTVKGHMGAIQRKLDANGVANAVFKAVRMGWLDKDTATPMPKVLVLVPKGSPPVEVIYVDENYERIADTDEED